MHGTPKSQQLCPKFDRGHRRTFNDQHARVLAQPCESGVQIVVMGAVGGGVFAPAPQTGALCQGPSRDRRHQGTVRGAWMRRGRQMLGLHRSVRARSGNLSRRGLGESRHDL